MRISFPRPNGLRENKEKITISEMIEAVEIEQMSVVQKLQTMELIWKSLATDENRVESPLWHQTVLESRLKKVEAGKGKFLTIAQLKKRLAKRTK